jgi:hypothetical protein
LEDDATAEDREARLGANDTLERGAVIFKGISDPDQAEFPLQPYSGRYGKAVSALFAGALQAILQILTGEAVQVFDHEKNTNRWCIQAIPNSRLLELGYFLARLQELPALGQLPTEQEFASFLLQWMADAQATLQDPNDPLAQIRTSSEKAARAGWAHEFEKLRESFDSARKAAQSAVTASQYEEQTKRARDAAMRAAGQTGALTLGQHFRNIVASEESSQRNWTVGFLVG